MTEKTVNTLLGAFVIGAVSIAVIAFLLMAGNAYDKSSERVVMVFDSSVKGLTVGAPVALRGVNIGEVTDIRVLFRDTDNLNLLMEVEAILQRGRVTRLSGSTNSMTDEIIAAGLRAQLNSQSLLTGLLYIQLDFFPNTPINLRATRDDILEVPTIPSRIDMLFEEIDRLDLPRLLSDVQRTALALRRFTENEDFNSFPATINETLEKSIEIAEDSKALLARLEPKLDQTLSSAAAASKTLERELPVIAQSFENSLDQLKQTLASLEGAGENLEAALDPDAPLLYSLQATLDELTKAGRAINSLARSVEEQPQSLILGRSGEAP
ncbi:mammalian cell entry related [Luminiphilus syltensis NOR5-1B]|uniref:Mammalian cell entry related n=1 Tax=Luminiphilus syltensis NOR5-1B TaxID=565045 RepID=B8KVH9_9GAMM|nr:MlaD family protein [Luminiphilus syltensis]EED36293.1 mammalian cell entry related [Luminiphilus syltensis NOR5-1B]